MQTVVETPAFLSDARSLELPDGERLAIVTWIAAHPEEREWMRDGFEQLAQMEEIARAQEAMFQNLAQNPPPLALVSQYLPCAYAAVRDGTIGASPAELAIAHVWSVLDDYHAAVTSAKEMHDD